MGIKASFNLALVVFLTALAITQLQQSLAGSYLERQAHKYLRMELHTATVMVGLASQKMLNPSQAVLTTARALRPKMSLENMVVFFGLDPEGRVLIPAGWPHKYLPDQHYLLHMLRLGRGNLEISIQGRRAWIYFDRVWDGETVLVVQGFAWELAGKALADLQYWTWVTSAGISLFAFLLAQFLFYFEFTRPFRRLTKEGERMAAGDLTSPEPLENRFDEVGRLSRVLNQLGRTALSMVEEAKRSQERFERLFTDSRDAIFMLDPEGIIIDANPAAVKMLRFSSRQEMLAHPHPEEFFTDQAKTRRFRRLLEKNGYVEDFDLKLKKADGTVFEALATATLQPDEGSSFAILRDVTLQRETERRLTEGEKRHRRLLDNSPDLIFRWNLDARSYDFLSPALENILGYKVEEAMRNPKIMIKAVHPDDRVFALSMHRDMLSQKTDKFEGRYRMIKKDGSQIWVRERSIVLKDARGKLLAAEGVISDITDQVQVEDALIKGRRMVGSVLQGLPAAVMVIGRDHKILHWNRAMENLTGVPSRERIGTDLQWSPFYPSQRWVLADYIVEGDLAGMEKIYGSNLLKKTNLVVGAFESEGFFKNLGGEDRNIYFLSAPMIDDRGNITGAVQTLIDLSDKRKLEEELTRLSITDELTGLYNQRFFYATLAREVESARRYNQDLALLLLDLDHFKNFNDTYGHLEGDEVLCRCGALIKSNVRMSDLAARYGGEEFVLLLPHTSRKRALLVAERIRKGIEDLEFLPRIKDKVLQKAHITASVGVAIYQESMVGKDLVLWADRAMYEAKNQGRNRVALRDDESEKLIIVRVGDKPAT